MRMHWIGNNEYNYSIFFSYNMAISIHPNTNRFYFKGCTLELLKRNKEALQRFLLFII